MSLEPQQNLAYCCQEILTVAARLRSGKFSVGDSSRFRTQIRRALELAEGAAQSLGYFQDDIRVASFAVIALLDETVLNSSNPAFRDWAQKPLMLELFNTLRAGETFYEYLAALLKRNEDKALIDLLEVYLLCLLLGFRGRYSAASGEQLRVWRDPSLEKIQRYRGARDYVALSPFWVPHADMQPPIPRIHFSRIVLSASLGLAGACVILLLLYNFLLKGGVQALAAYASG